MPEEGGKMEKNKNKKAVKRLRLGTVLVGLFLILYIPSFVLWIYGDGVNTDIIRMGEIERSENVDAFIVRSEVVMSSPMDGKCIKDINEGERISANSRIATILNTSSEKLLDDLRMLDLKIITAQREESKTRDFFSADVRKLDKEIEDRLMVLIDYTNQNKLTEIRKVKDEIDGIIHKQASIIGGLSRPTSHINALISERNVLQDRINQNTRDVFSKYPGTVSYFVDGYEQMLTPQIIEQLTLNDLNSIKIEKKQKEIDDLNVKENEPFTKVINGINYYIVFTLNYSMSHNYQIGDRVNIRINDVNRVVDGIITHKSDEDKGKAIISVMVDKALSETAGLRKINIDLIKSRHSGFIVPLKSLVNVDTVNMKAEIALVRANRARFTPVKITGMDKDFAVITNEDISFGSGIRLYSSYIINPKNIEEGQIIN
ncbi:UNVERIFIED_CONTAM: putative membrane fusion protein [Acetivibrio alkalicellulosi]